MTAGHAFSFLSAESPQLPDVIAVVGGDATLRLWSIWKAIGDGDRSSFDGESLKWSDIRDDLSTASLFDLGDKRSIVIRDADPFVSKYRGEIEGYLEKPSSASRLILELQSLAKNTRVYKLIDKHHQLVVCGMSTEKGSGITAASRRKFLSEKLGERHSCQLENAAIDGLLDALGDDLGMIDTEVAKLALYVDPGGKIDRGLVDSVVGGWQAKSVWQITDAIATGNAADALKHLDKLILGGQRPIALLPQIAFALRKLGMATAIVEHLERSDRKWRLEDAVAAAMDRPYQVAAAAAQLKKMGRHRGRKLLPWLLDADLRLKGTHSQEGRDRMLLEHLVFRLAAEAQPDRG